MYDVIQGRSGWVLRHRRTPLVEFPTRLEAVRAGIVVCRDEGLGPLVITGADGVVEEIDPVILALDTLEA